MKNAPALILIALFDAVEAVKGAHVAVFERHHPEAPAAFRAWCSTRGCCIDQHEHEHMTLGGERISIRVLRAPGVDISIHLDTEPKQEAA